MVQNDECIPVGDHYVICRNKEAYKSPAINLIRNLSLLENMITIPYFREHYKKIPIRIHLSHNFIANKKQFPNRSEQINITTGCIDTYWCLTRLTIFHYDYFVKKNKKDIRTASREELEAIDYYMRRLCLLKMIDINPHQAIFDELNKWPPHIPLPGDIMEKYNEDDSEAIASEIALHAVAFILFHECAHSYCGHEKSDPSIEYEADNLAMEAFFDAKSDQSKKEKNLFGTMVALSLSFLQFLNNLRWTSESHPSVITRINKIISKYSNILSLPPDEYKADHDSMDMRPIIGYAESMFFIWGQVWPKAFVEAKREIYELTTGNLPDSMELTEADKELLETASQIKELLESKKFVNPIDSYHALSNLLLKSVEEIENDKVI